MQLTRQIQLFALIVLFGNVAVNAFGDEPAPSKYLTGDALRQVFENTTMKGEYRIFRDKTRTYQYTEFHSAKGTTDYREGKRVEPGLWKIIGEDKICYRYPKSDQYNSVYCFFVYNVEGCYYKFSPSAMTLKGPKNWDLWTSRAVRKGHGGTCDVPMS